MTPGSSSPLRRRETAVVGVCTLLALVPLWGFKYTPATDLPQHVALSAVGFRLLQNDALTQAAYAFNLQPVPYYLVYVLMIPAVGWLGPIAGTKAVLTLTALGIVGAMALLCRALGRPPVLALGGVFIFYSAVFFWGFITTLVGVPCVLLAAWALLRHARTGRAQYAVGAACLAAATCCAHVILVPALGAAVAGYVAIAPRRHFKVACTTLAAALLPCGPWFWSIATRAGGHAPEIRWETPLQAWEHARLYLGPFDHGAGRNAHQMLLVLLACLVIGARPRARAQATAASSPDRPIAPPGAGRFLAWFGGGNAALFFAVPLVFKSDQNYVWLVNMRYLMFAEAALFLACTCAPRARLEHAWRWGVVACCIVFLAALTRFWAGFDRDMRPFDDVLAQIPPDATLTVRNGFEHYARAWPFVTINMHAYALARGVQHESTMFDSAYAHMPVRARPRAAGTADRAAATGAFEDPKAEGPLAMAPYDYALMEGSPAMQRDMPAPVDGELIYTAGYWRLYRRLKPVAAADIPQTANEAAQRPAGPR